MKKVSVATIQGKWTGDFKSNAAWYREQALSLKGKKRRFGDSPRAISHAVFSIRRKC